MSALTDKLRADNDIESAINVIEALEAEHEVLRDRRYRERKEDWVEWGTTKIYAAHDTSTAAITDALKRTN